MNGVSVFAKDSVIAKYMNTYLTTREINYEASVGAELDVKMTNKLGYIFIKKDKTGLILVADQKVD